jgi:hypothetical protein
MVKMAFGVLEVAARGAIGRALLPADAALMLCAQPFRGPLKTQRGRPDRRLGPSPR